jgi:hypothetical protein
VQIADLERDDLGAAQTDLQADRQDRTIAEACDRVLSGASSTLRACAFENASVEPSSRLIAGRSTSPTGLRVAWPWRTRCL